ncbi:metallophosphoesterase [Phyllobacterium salinisoli]|uniref:Phosphoesterase n=1 Tax=Phyllobacterium salinisoli TaxID=1899321 RepID=A0A368JZX4_9HYPH|nr:metallophosphoesterase family protein [Phyllobacterium salinisoli]RCS21753.1 metallophosphoesterase [Phyllobacterium salinisoli]
MHTLGVISDIHGLFRDETVKLLDGVDHIVHAGDIGDPKIIERLEATAPVSAIRGNIDGEARAAIYPDTLRLTLFGHEIFLIHDRNDLRSGLIEKSVSIVISGHSHRASIETLDGVVYLNPGSAGPRRFKLPATLATVHICKEKLVPTIHPII